MDYEFITNNPLEMIKKPPALNVPILIGSTSMEIEFFPLDFKMINVHLPNKNHSILHEINQYLEHFLNSSIDERTRQMKKHFIHKLRNMADINYGMNQFIDAYGHHTDKPIFLYRFSFAGKFANFQKDKITSADTAAIDGGRYGNGDGSGGGGDGDGHGDRNGASSGDSVGRNGAVHGDELVYLLKEFFHLNATGDRRGGIDDYGSGDVSSSGNGNSDDDAADDGNMRKEILTRKRMVEMWTNFIKFR